MLKIAAIGECMLELSNPAARPLERNLSLQFSYGGDTLNTAVYMARLNVACAYVTALGDDPYSNWLLAEWEKERIDTQMVVQLPGRTPGLYMIQTDGRGERSFYYWRKNAPARELFSEPGRSNLINTQLRQYDLIYLSGITLSLYDDESLARLFTVLQDLRSRGKRIVFDGNYRPAGWFSAERARSVFQRLTEIADIILPTFEDEAMLFGDSSPSDTVRRLRSCGATEIAVKHNAEGVLVGGADSEQWVTTTPVGKVTDSTAAGDSFNAAYLAARAHGLNPLAAAECGNTLAGIVIQHSGAIIPSSAMPRFNF